MALPGRIFWSCLTNATLPGESDLTLSILHASLSSRAHLCIPVWHPWMDAAPTRTCTGPPPIPPRGHIHVSPSRPLNAVRRPRIRQGRPVSCAGPTDGSQRHLDGRLHRHGPQSHRCPRRPSLRGLHCWRHRMAHPGSWRGALNCVCGVFGRIQRVRCRGVVCHTHARCRPLLVFASDAELNE